MRFSSKCFICSIRKLMMFETLVDIASTPANFDSHQLDGASEGFIAVFQEFQQRLAHFTRDVALRRIHDRPIEPEDCIAIQHDPSLPSGELETFRRIVVREVLFVASDYQLTDIEADLVVEYCLRIGPIHVDSWRKEQHRFHHRSDFTSSKRTILLAIGKALAKEE